MSSVRTPLGDSHNFGRRVSLSGDRVAKPRTLTWEWLTLAEESPLRRLLDEAAARDGLAPTFFDFVPRLKFYPPGVSLRDGGEVERVALEPLPARALSLAERRELALIVGRSLALWSWLGVSDLHWENLVLGVDAGAGRAPRMVFGPLDVEMILADLSWPTETKLLPDADPEVADICRHACGVRRVLPYLGKPVQAGDLLAMVGEYHRTLVFLDRHTSEIALVFGALPGLQDIPIRVCLRGTEEYVLADSRALWPPLLEAEEEQMARGDVPYFFRLYGRPGIHYFADASLSTHKTLPTEGDVPQLDPMLDVSRSFRSPSRKKLREEGIFTLLGAFDHKGLTGSHEDGDLTVTFARRSLLVTLPADRRGRREELESKRNLRDFVGSVYLPCGCGEVHSVFVPAVTVCDAAQPRT